MRTVVAPLVCMATLASIHASAWATPGALDTTFNTTGLVKMTVGTGESRATAMAVQGDGRIVLAGGSTSDGATYHLTVVRLLADGSPDPAFSGDGIATVEVSPFGDGARAVALQSDGKIVVAGWMNNGSDEDFAVVRLNADGTLDGSFGQSGIVTTDFGNDDDTCYGMALQQDGGIVVAGEAKMGGMRRFAWVRYDSAGTPDLTVTTAIGTSATGRAVAVQPDGKIVVAGSATPDMDPWAMDLPTRDHAIARYNSDGTLDASFGNGGTKTLLNATGAEDIQGIALQPDGKVVVAGISLSDFGNYFEVFRFNADGTLDNTTHFHDSLTNGGARALAIEPDGGVVAAGYLPDASGTVRHFTPATLPDAGFGTMGGVSPAGFGSLEAIVLQPDGKLIVAGATTTIPAKLAVARYVLVDTAWDVTPGPFSYTEATGVTPSTTQTSGAIIVGGLGAGVSVPVRATNGQVSKDGVLYQDAAWVQNGDMLAVRHVAASGEAQANSTFLSVGGLQPANNAMNVIGTTETAAFTSTTSTAPTVDSGTGTFEVAENSSSGTLVTVIGASDADGHALNYSIGAGNIGNVFDIDDGGAITVVGALDYETRSSYALIIDVNDGHGLTTSGVVTVNLTDVADGDTNTGGSGNGNGNGSGGGGGGGGGGGAFSLGGLLAGLLLSMRATRSRRLSGRSRR